MPGSRPLCDFLTTLWDTGADAIKQMSKLSRGLLVVVLLLAFIQIWQRSTGRGSSSRRAVRQPPDYSNRYAYASEQIAVAAAVRGALKDYFDAQVQPSDAEAGSQMKRELGSKEVEVKEIMSQVEVLEARLARLKKSLTELD